MSARTRRTRAAARPTATRAAAAGRRDGFALVIVLLVLLLLLVLATPFLLSARNADRASVQAADRAEGRVALDAAARRARAVLGASHPAIDRTPYYDSLDELAPEEEADPAFLDPRDPRGAMWDAELVDLAGRIDLASAPPQVIANLAGGSSRFAQPIEPDSKELALSSTAGFEPQGYAWVLGETIRYDALEANQLVRFDRGLLGPPNAEDWKGGPRPPSQHEAGAPVIDQRALALPLWRLATEDGELRAPDAIEDLPETAAYALSVASGAAQARGRYLADVVAPLAREGSVHSGLRAGPVWQHPTRLVAAVVGGEDGQVRVDDRRWFNPGATVQVSGPSGSELALVQDVEQNRLVLDRVLANDYEPYSAVVRVLARRPVNLNTASPEVLRALFANLQVEGRNSRITKDEATALVEAVIAARPFDGFEDFVRRLVLPAAGIAPPEDGAPQRAEGFLDEWDALALYANGLNANDGRLAYATMPFAFTARDVYAFELRASVNAPSMAERASFVREQVEVVVPQRELFSLWARQEDFDESARLADAMPWWIAGPRATSRFDRAAPGSRRWASVAALEARVGAAGDPAALAAVEAQAQGEWVFPSRDETAWVQLAPARVAEDDRTEGRVLHFDDETRDLEGRYLPDQPIALAASDARVAWTGSTGLAKPLALSLWIEPRSLVDALYLDVRGSSIESDRVTLGYDSATQDLVLRVLDAPGDHPASAFVEAAEARYSTVEGGASPGLPLDVWHHVEIDVRGTRPDQIHLLVNGLAHGVRVPGMSRLAASVTPEDVALVLESVEGFPERGCVQIGDELVEYRLDAANKVLVASHESSGEFAGHGGRLARELFAHSADGEGAALVTGVGTHPAGTTVRLYGYSSTLRSNVGVGGAQLARPLRRFAVAIAKSVALSGSSSGSPEGGEPIVLTGVPANWSALGYGIEGASSQATAIELGSFVPGEADAAVAESFPSTGGYVLLVQRRVTAVGGFGNLVTQNGSQVGGAEIVWYSERQGTRLVLGQRGDGTGLEAPGGDFTQRRAFVARFGAGYTELNDFLEWKLFVIPISIGVTGSGGLAAFPTPSLPFSEFAQITELDDAELTEWLRYDEIRQDHLVRCAPEALRAAWSAAVRLDWDGDEPVDPPPFPPGGGGGGAALAIAPPPPAAAPAQDVEPDASLWQDTLGEPDPIEDPLTRAVRTRLQFRGVMGTHTNPHTLASTVLPTFRVDEAPGKAPGAHPDGGIPGALDHAFLLEGNPTALGTPVVVHRAHQPYDYVASSWQPDPGDPSVAVEGETETLELEDVNQDSAWKVDLEAVYVGLREACPVPYVPGTNAPPGATQPSSDARLRARLVLHPSGELPREIADVAIGGGAQGAGGTVPAATVDEVVFGDARFGSSSGVAAGSAEEVLGASLVLLEAIDDATLDARLSPAEVRIARGRFSGSSSPLVAELASRGAGLLKIGEEILAFTSVDPQQGDLVIAEAGRGLLGTIAQPHGAGEPVTWLEQRMVAAIDSAPGAQDAELPFTTGAETSFPSDGTLLLGSELLHYTRVHGNAFEMPRASSVPGALDEEGEGLFRGRFGTTAEAHPAGAAAILFPIRYWDRWTPRADAPELGFCGGSIDQPDAYWSSFFFAEEEVEGCELGVLVRLDPRVPWDADPEQERRLRVLDSGDENGAPIPLGAQSDQLSWRVFARYAPGAFAADTGLGHGWRRSPRLSRLGAFYFGPGVVLRSVER